MTMYASTLLRILAMLAIPSMCWAQTAYLQPPTVFEGDIAELIIEQESKIPSLYALDTSVLDDDFIVLDKSSKLFRIASEGEVTNRMQWTVRLSPRRSGKLEVPSLSLGKRLTPRLVLDVVRLTKEEAAQQQVTVQIQVFPENPYVGQQTIISLRMLHNTPLIDGQLSEPVSAQADMYRSGEETRYSQIEGGEEFEVTQRNILLFARSPGELSLAPANFRGQIPVNSSSLSSSTRRINRNSNDLMLKVRDIPAAFGGRYWLPASDLQISESWDQADKNLKVGDSINRNLTIIAKGLPADLLPEDLLTSNSDRVKVYADKVSRENNFEGADLVGSLSQTFVVVLTEAGDISLPEFRLSWWDVDEDVEKQAIIPERKISIVDASVMQDNEDFISTEDNGVWLAVGLAFSVIMALSFYLKKSDSRLARYIDLLARCRSLKQACLSAQPKLARSELLAWASGQWPNESIIGLFQIENLVESVEFKNEIRQLDKVLFSSGKKSWNGDKLYRLLQLEQRRLSSQTRPEQPVLPRLYAPTP